MCVQNVSVGVDEKLSHAGMQLFPQGKMLTAGEIETDEEEEEDDDEDEEEGDLDEEDEEERAMGFNYEEDDEGEGTQGEEEEEDEEEEEGDEDEDDDEEEEDSGDEEEEEEEEESEEESGEEEGARWKDRLADRAKMAFLDRERQQVDLMELVYGKASRAEGGEEEEEEDDLDFFRPRKEKARTDDWGLPLDLVDVSRVKVEQPQDWDAEGDGCAIEELRRRFITGGWGKDGEEGGEGEEGDDGEVYGDFEDLETGETFTGSRKLDKEDEEIRRLAAKAELKAKFDEEYENKKLGGKGEEEEEEADEDAEALELAKKMREEQAARNREEFGEEGEGARLRYEGFRQGLYVRIVIKAVPAEFSQHFRPHVPVVLGGLLPHETSMGLIRARVKRHRWHRKVRGHRPSHPSMTVGAGFTCMFK